MNRIKNIAWLITLIISTNAISQRVINVDLNSIKGAKSNMFNVCVGAGRANEALRSTWRKQLEVSKKEIGFKYLRFHGLLHDDMGVYSEDKQGKPHYNWQYVDDLYDYLLSIGVKPFVELSFMPSALASDKKTVFWWKGNITPPKDWDKWSGLITALTKHFEDRYGKKEVEQWYFEVWNEPNYKGFWSGTQEEYFKLYEVTANAIKSVSPTYRVGGPGSSGVSWIEETLNYCTEHHLPLDFLSTHSYNVDGVPIDEFGNKELQLKANPDAVVDDVKGVKAKLSNSIFKNSELHFTEWSSSYSANDPVHDTYENAPFVLHTLKHTEPYVNSMSYWVFTDVFEEGGVPKTPFYGGFGLINLENIKKPTFYAYKFLNDLSPIEINNSDQESYINKSKDNKHIQALFWDFSYPKMDKEIDNVYFKKLHPSVDKGTTEVVINNIPNGIYKVEIYKIGYRNNDPFSVYYDLGLPDNINAEQVAQLKKLSDGSPVETKDITITNGVYKQWFGVKSNDVVFVKLTKK